MWSLIGGLMLGAVTFAPTLAAALGLARSTKGMPAARAAPEPLGEGRATGPRES